MPIRLCSIAGCNGSAIKGGRCVVHTRQAVQARGPRIYDLKRWKRAREHKLRQQWECELHHPGCLIIASEVHHRRALQDGGDPYAQENLTSSCKPCHSHETRREQLQRGYGG